MFSNLTHPCTHSRNFIIASVMLCNNRQLLRLKKCAINLNTPPLHRCNVHLHSYIRRSSLNYPDPPFVYVSGATHSAQPCTETRAFFSLLPSLPSYSFCCPRLYSMANHSAEVYLNPSLKFTLPRPYLNRACHLFYTKHSSPLARQTDPCHYRECIQSRRTESREKEGRASILQSISSVSCRDSLLFTPKLNCPCFSGYSGYSLCLIQNTAGRHTGSQNTCHSFYLPTVATHTTAARAFLKKV